MARAKRWVVWIVALLIAALAISTACAAPPPQVQQPDSATFSAAERAALLRELAGLEAILASTEWGSGEQGSTSYDFALYTAGTLGQLGYEAAVVTSVSWPGGGPHTWVLAGVSVGSRLAWIPVEATPGSGTPQSTLGFVPKALSSASQFDARYIAFDRVEGLPPNQPPVAAVRPPTSFILVGESATFLALSSYDPDGEIILYLWRADGERQKSRTTKTWHHAFSSPGNHTVELTVVDNRGARTTTTLAVEILSEKPAPEERGPSSGCGCGK